MGQNYRDIPENIELATAQLRIDSIINKLTNMKGWLSMAEKESYPEGGLKRKYGKNSTILLKPLKLHQNKN